jgi:hypothetical protein
MAIIRQRSGDGRAMSFRSAVNVGANAVPESLDFNVWEVCIFLPEDRFVGGEDVNEVWVANLTTVTLCNWLAMTEPGKRNFVNRRVIPQSMLSQCLT